MNDRYGLSERLMTEDEFLYMKLLHEQLMQNSEYYKRMSAGQTVKVEILENGYVLINSKKFSMESMGLEDILEEYVLLQFSNVINYDFDFARNLSLMSCHCNFDDSQRELILMSVPERYNLSAFQKTGVLPEVINDIKKLGMDDKDYFYVTRFFMEQNNLCRSIYSASTGSRYIPMGGTMYVRDLPNDRIDNIVKVIDCYELKGFPLKELYIIGDCESGKVLFRKESDGEYIVIAY